MLEVAEQLKGITEKERIFLRGCHRIRNDLYHGQGEAQEYYKYLFQVLYITICDLISRLSKGFQGYRSDTVFSKIELYYASQSKSRFFIDESKLSNALLEKIGKIDANNFIRSICEDANGIKSDFQNAISFIKENHPKGLSGAELIVQAQFSYQLEKHMEKFGFDRAGYFSPRSKESHDRYLEFKKNFSPAYRGVPHRFWRQCINSIKETKSPIEAYWWYDQINDRLGSLISSIFHLESEVDGWIQSEIDRSRGK